MMKLSPRASVEQRVQDLAQAARFALDFVWSRMAGGPIPVSEALYLGRLDALQRLNRLPEAQANMEEAPYPVTEAETKRTSRWLNTAASIYWSDVPRDGKDAVHCLAELYRRSPRLAHAAMRGVFTASP